MHRRARFERRALLQAQIDNLAAPAIPDDTPALDMRVLVLEELDDLGDALDRLGRCSGALEEGAELLAFVFVVWRVPGNVRRLAFEEVRHEDLVGVLRVGEGEDVGALQSLREEAEDVVDDQEGAFGVGGAGGVCVGAEVGVGLVMVAGGVLQVLIPSTTMYWPL